MPTLTAARDERKKKDAGASVDFNAIWDIVDSSLIQDEGKGVYRCTDVGDGEVERVGQLRTRQALAPQTGPSSVEITILDTGERNAICIGVCSKDYPTDLMPGSKDASIAMHTADGSIFHFPHDPEPLGFSCRRGCVVKCSLVPDPLDNACGVVEFFKDGERVRVIPTPLPEGGLYGVVGMLSGGGERILVSPPVITRWLDFNHVWEVCTPHVLQHYRGGLCTYVGPEYLSIGTVRTKQRIDPFGPLSGRCFGIRIVDPGEKMYIAIGICSRTYPHNMLPGWEETSVGYHADNGHLFYNSDSGQPTHHPCKRGDTMRCTVQPTDGSQKQVSVVFHCNSQLVGKLTAWTPEDGFYGCFGMMSKNECVQVTLPEISEPYEIPKASFLSVWEVITPHLQYQERGVFAYCGTGRPDSIGSVRSKAPLDPSSPNNTFEVKIIDPGDRCYIALGVCNRQYPGTQLPGWTENSVGFHADNGLILNGFGDEQIETRCYCMKGDVIRCTVELVDGSNKQINVLFHRNSALIGKVLLWNSKEGFYAQVGSMSTGEVIQIASPQTMPSSLLPDTASRSMSVPIAQVTREAVKRKQFSTQEYSRMTPAVEGESDKEPFSEHHIPRVQTTPVLKATSHQTHEEELSHHTAVQTAVTPHHGYQVGQSEDLHQHQLHHNLHHKYAQISSPHPLQLPQGEHLLGQQGSGQPLHHAGTSSPYQLQPSGGHPLGQQGLAGRRVQAHLHDVKQSPTGATTASDTQYSKPAKQIPHQQISSESQTDGSLRAVSPSYEHTTPQSGPLTTRDRVQTQPIVTHKPAILNRPHSVSPPLKPLVPNFAPGKTSPSGSINTPATLGGRITERELDYTDNPTAANDRPSFESLPPRHDKVVSDKLEHVQEPDKEVKVSAAPPLVHLFTKKENSLCRILHNASCNEDGTLQCTLSTDSSESSFVMYRLQLTEKMPYFEVELMEYDDTQNIVVGLVPQEHPYTTPIGSLRCTIAYHIATGTLVREGKESRSITKTCTTGDVIGCKVEWSYKLEVCDPRKESLVKVEWFRNGCSFVVKNINVPSSGLHPAIEMTCGSTVVMFRHTMGLKPDSFFNSHPLPDGFTNIEVPSHTTEDWKCLQNAQIDDDKNVLFGDESSPLPTVVQSQTPFTSVRPYFEVELQYPVSSYSILSVGALERVPNSKQCIPGEAPDSIALFPLLSFVMRNGSISSTLPRPIEDEMKNSSEKLRIGVGVDFNQKIPLYTSTARRVKIFFTINCQLVNSTYVTIPSTGLCPTIAVGSDFRKLGERLLRLQFSNPRPEVSSLPLGFARAPRNAFKTRRSRTVVAENGLPEGSDTPQAIQAALPLSISHSYFEMKIVQCHESHVFSCGVTPRNASLTGHPGNSQDSIGFFPSEGSVHHNGQSVVVCPPCSYKGAKIGCGARFPNDGSSKYMEVFFTVNGSMVARRLVEVHQPGLFPTLGFYTKGNGIVNADLYAEDPFPDLQFNTTWRDLNGMKAEGAVLQTTSTSEPCVAQLVQAVLPHTPSYFTITLQSDIDTILFGFSNHVTCPLLDNALKSYSKEKGVETLPLPEGWAGCLVNMAMGEALVVDKLYSVERCSFEQSQVYGCGVEPIKNSNCHLFFFTRNNQVVFCRKFHLSYNNVTLFPTIFVSGQTARLHIDACALWPIQTVIGKGWSQINHLMLENSKIRHSATDKHQKIPVGFAQTSMPIISSLTYFEVEVCSRSVDKAIAVGLAARTYPSNTWVGWKPGSVAYHLDDGNLFTGSGMFSHKIGPKIFQGHIVGCGVNAKPSDSETNEGQKVEVFFTVNGAVIVEQKIAVPGGGFYPTICLESPTESLIFNRYPRFPPVQNLMSSDWGNCYSVHLAGVVIEHSCRHKELPPRGIPRGFCQASRPFSPDRSYFEIKIVRVTSIHSSVIQAGAAVEIPLGCRSPSTDSVMYSSSGQVQVRFGGNKTTTTMERCNVGDVVGCGVVYSDNQPTAVEFYLNKMKLQEIPLLQKWQGVPLFPTIILSQRGNAVLPRLNLSPPKWDRSSLIGWLRSVRVQVRGNIAEYHPSNAEKKEVGLCQISQCLEQNSSFEVEVLDKGEECLIAVGAASTNYPPSNQPGWKENSVAYHGDDGFLFSNDPYGVSFGPTWKEGDIIGVGVRQPKFESPNEHETQVYFMKNGLELGHTTVAIPPSGLFPTIGFHSPGEKVKISLNSSPNRLGNSNTALLQWRDMCGIRLQATSQESQCVLSYYDNGRKLPRTGIKLAQAVYGEPFSEKLQYFEVDLLSMGAYSAIAIGVVPKRYRLDYAPGWGKDSLGYHTDNGQLYQARDRGKYFGPIAKKGDIIGCGINFVPNNQRQCSVYFTYNGVEIGRIRSSIPATGLYPSLCLMHKYDKVRVTVLETFKPKVLIPELHMVGLMRISHCAYSDQIVQFTGGSTQVSAPGIAQFAVPMHKDRNYFAAHVLKAEDTIMIGLAVRDYPLKYPPGSMSISMAYDITKGSIRAVYDSDNFHKFNNPDLICSVGDRVGCGVVFSDSKSKPSFVYFTRNGTIVRRIPFPELFEDLYPVVGFIPEQRSSLLFMDWNMPFFDSPNLLCDC